MSDVTDSAGEALMKGDLIEFYRGLYSHWAIFDGAGHVIHVTGEPNADPGFGSFAPSVGSANALSGNVTAEVKRERLKKVANGDKFYKKNIHDDRKTPFRPEEIIERASEMIGKCWDYDLIRKNCEHFVCMMRYDLDVSQQVVDAAIKVTAATAVGVFVGIGIALVGTFLSSSGEKKERTLHRR